MPSPKISELASKLNMMQNPSKIGVSIGKVVKTSPFTVSIAGGSILLVEGDELYVCERLKAKTYKATLKWTDGRLNATVSITDVGSGTLSSTDTSGKSEGTIKIDPEVEAGDKVLVVPTDSEQTWIAVDRIGE